MYMGMCMPTYYTDKLKNEHELNFKVVRFLTYRKSIYKQNYKVLLAVILYTILAYNNSYTMCSNGNCLLQCLITL